MIKEEFLGRCCRRESVFPADNSSVTRGDGLNFPFGKTRRIRVNKSSMQTAKPNNVFVLSVISDLRFRQKSPRNSTWRRSRLSKPWAEKWSWCFLWIRKKAKGFRRPDNRSRPGTEIRWPPSKTLFILRRVFIGLHLVSILAIFIHLLKLFLSMELPNFNFFTILGDPKF